jgi:hypothetical protein
MWRASASVDRAPLIDVLFDATDIVDGRYVSLLVTYDPALRSELSAFRTDTALASTPIGRDVNHLSSKMAPRSTWAT